MRKYLYKNILILNLDSKHYGNQLSEKLIFGMLFTGNFLFTYDKNMEILICK